MQTVLAVGPEKIPKINKCRAFNKAVGPGKKSYLKKLHTILKKNVTKQNVHTVLAVGPRKNFKK